MTVAGQAALVSGVGNGTVSRSVGMDVGVNVGVRRVEDEIEGP